MREPLTQIIGDLVAHKQRKWVRLGRGLRLAFTPANQNNGRFRLCLSRPGKRPSVDEGYVVAEYLKKALASQARAAEALTITPNQIVAKQSCTIIEWGELKQSSLIDFKEEKCNVSYHGD